MEQENVGSSSVSSKTGVIPLPALASMEGGLTWPPLRKEWDALVGNASFAANGLKALQTVVKIWDEWESGQSDDDALTDLAESNVPLAALHDCVEKRIPGTLEVMIAIAERDMELADLVFGDAFSEIWEPAVMTLCETREDLDKLVGLAERRDAFDLGRIYAVHGIDSCANPVHGHTLAKAAAEKLRGLLETLSMRLNKPEEVEDDAEVFATALSSVVLTLAPHGAEDRQRFLDWYDVPQVMDTEILGSPETFRSDVARDEPFVTRPTSYPFRAWDFIERFNGTEEVILAARLHERKMLMDALLATVNFEKKRIAKRKAQKKARKKGRK